MNRFAALDDLAHQPGITPSYDELFIAIVLAVMKTVLKEMKIFPENLSKFGIYGLLNNYR